MTLLTTTQLADMLNVSPDTARRICKRRGFQVGHLWGIDERTAKQIMFARRARKRKWRRRRLNKDYARHRAAILERARQNGAQP